MLHMGSIVRMDPKPHSKCWDVSGLPLQLLAQNRFFQSDKPEPPPPLLANYVINVHSTSNTYLTNAGSQYKVNHTH